MKSFQERITNVTRGGWIRAAIWGTLYVLFVFWVAWGDWKSLGWLVLLPLVLDIFTTRYINYSWWKKYRPAQPGEPENPHANGVLYTICSWVDAILFALVAVYFINLYLFQNYQIPSSSLEKSLRVGDFLFVSKASYGPRVPFTPLSMPLVQHNFPEWLGGGQSFIEHPHWEYKRLRGWDHPTKGDIVVFNFPAGDTVCMLQQKSDYYTLCHYYGYSVVNSRTDIFGEKVYRPVDQRENYVKRLVGEPGDSLRIIDNIVYTYTPADGTAEWQAEPFHEGLQLCYIVRTDGTLLTAKYLDKIGISHEDRTLIQPGIYHLPLTVAMKAELEKNPHIVSITVEDPRQGGAVYPLGHNDWTRDNYGPIYIPKKGDRILITEQNYPLYRRIGEIYEQQPMHIGEEYTFLMDYYWMQGDNRHKSADSRYWGFVPEDHIVGRPVFIWLSIEKDRPWFHGHIRWSRIGQHATH